MKKILILGKGGREHALAKKFLESEHVNEVVVCPGNPGISLNEKIKVLDREDFLQIALELLPDLVFVGPENYLELGIADDLRSHGFRVVGPSKKAALLESSKAYMKGFLDKNNINTAKYYVEDKYEDVCECIDKNFDNEKIVLKTDELAAGKGVFICNNKDDAKKIAYKLFHDDNFVIKSQKIIIEEFLEGKEVSVFYYIKDDRFILLGSVCDYKKLSSTEDSPNTGGMGCYIPQNLVTPLLKRDIEEIVLKTINGLKNEGVTYEGILFLGLMINDNKVKVLEYNVRFGDPEAQTLLPAIKNDFIDILDWKIDVVEHYAAAIHVVLVSENYANLDNKKLLLNQNITINKFKNDKAIIYFSSVDLSKNTLVNNGGRVLGVTLVGNSLDKCRNSIYEEVKKIKFNGCYYRNDIGVNYV